MNYEQYIEHLAQPVAVLDRLHQVISANAAFMRLFPMVEHGESLRAFTDVYAVLQPALVGGERSFRAAYNGRDYIVNIFFVTPPKGHTPVGRCILMTDVNDMAVLVEQIRQEQSLLHEANARIALQNEQLTARIRLEEETAALRAQMALVRDIHDTLGHSLLQIDALHSLAAQALPDAAKARVRLEEAVRQIGISIAEVSSVGDFRLEDLTDFFSRFRVSMARVGLTIELHLTGATTPAHQYMYADLMRICQEAATNAIKHGNATVLRVFFHADDAHILLRIEDNGHSDRHIGQGFGLAGMDERANNLFGEFEYGWTDGGGFYIHLDAPVIDEEE